MRLHYVILVAMVLAMARVAFPQQPLHVDLDEPLTLRMLRRGMEHVSCPENSVKVLGEGLFEVHCMCVNGTFGDGCKQKIASDAAVDSLEGLVADNTEDIGKNTQAISSNAKSSGYFPALQQPQLSSEGQLYSIAELDSSLAGLRPTAAEVKFTTRLIGHTNSYCGVTTSLQGTHSSSPVETSYVFVQPGNGFRELTWTVTVPLDPENPQVMWTWVFYGIDPSRETGCYLAGSAYPPSNKVLLLGVYS